MTDPLPSDPRPAGAEDGKNEQGAPPRPGGPRRVVLAGVWTFLGPVALACMPLLWGRSGLNRFFVAFGFVGACLGASIMLHGTWDWLTARAGGRKAERR